MSKLNDSIVKKTGLTIFVFILILFTLYYNFLNVQMKNYLEQQGKEQLEKESEYLSGKIELFLNKYILIVEEAKNNLKFTEIAGDITNRNTKRNHPLYAEVSKDLTYICNLDENITNAYIALEGASDLITNDYAYDIASDYQLSDRDWYTNTISQDKTTITTPYVDFITQKTAITVATPIKDDEGNLLGVLGLDILIEDINSIMNDYNAEIEADVGLIYDNGLILYTPNSNDFTGTTRRYIQDLLGNTLAKKVISGESGVALYGLDREAKYVAYFPIKGTNVIAFTNILKSKILAPVDRFILINLYILLLVIIVIVLFLLFLERVVSTPLYTICNQVENYANDRSIHLPQEYLNRRDEVGVLSNGITFMLNRISNYIAELKEKNGELQNAKEKIDQDRILFKTTLRSLGDGVISTDQDGMIQIMNDVAEQLTGWEKQTALGQPFESVFRIVNGFTDEKRPNPVEKVLKKGLICEIEENTVLIKKNGEKIPIEDSAAPIYDNKGNITGVVIVFRDFTDKKLKQEKISYLSCHDQLTGLYNRHFFDTTLNALNGEESLPLSLAMLDVNGLKLTNDAFGHQVGDKLLQTIAGAIKKVCRADDVACRIGGDEFVIFMPKTNFTEMELLMNHIYQEIEKAKIENLVISVSIGWETKTSSKQNTMEIYAKAEENMYRKKLVESQRMRRKTLQLIIKNINETNTREKDHSENVSKLSKKIGKAMHLDKELLRKTEIAGRLHDIGKIGVSNTILEKPGKLTELEYEIVKRHAEVGYHILKSVDTYTNFADYILAHHERWDGTGYPRGLAGEEIPLVSRILTVADAYEAMTSERSYKKALGTEEAIAELKRCSGTQFDPKITSAFINVLKKDMILAKG